MLGGMVCSADSAVTLSVVFALAVGAALCTGATVPYVLTYGPAVDEGVVLDLCVGYESVGVDASPSSTLVSTLLTSTTAVLSSLRANLG